jgi:L-ascorbate metabolism protein UlaG (beta-lactamase superfamily)
VAGAEARDEGRQHLPPEPLGTGQAHGAREAGVAARGDPLHRKRRGVDLLDVPEDRGLGGRQREAAGRPAEEPRPEATLEGLETATDRWLRDAEAARRRRQVSVPRHHEEESQVVPVERLPKDTPFIVPPSIEPLVREAGFSHVRTLDWGESLELAHGAARLRITAVPAHHSDDPAIDVQVGKVNGYVLAWDGPGGRYTAYWTGDCVVLDGQVEGLASFGPIDLLLPHMAGDGPFGLRTMNADEAVQLIARLRPREVIPIHTTFGHHREPVSALVQRVAAAGLDVQLIVVPEGREAPLCVSGPASSPPGG